MDSDSGYMSPEGQKPSAGAASIYPLPDATQPYTPVATDSLSTSAGGHQLYHSSFAGGSNWVTAQGALVLSPQALSYESYPSSVVNTPSDAEASESPSPSPQENQLYFGNPAGDNDLAEAHVPSVLTYEAHASIVGNIPFDAEAFGFTPLMGGFDPLNMSMAMTQIEDLHKAQNRLGSLRYALMYACEWAFPNFEALFVPRIGIVHARDVEIGIFLSFEPGKSTSTMSSEFDGEKISDMPEFVYRGDCSPTLGDPGASLLPTYGPSRETKNFVAQRLLHLILRCYGPTPTPKTLWFVEVLPEAKGYVCLQPYRAPAYDSNKRDANIAATRRIRAQLYQRNEDAMIARQGLEGDDAEVNVPAAIQDDPDGTATAEEYGDYSSSLSDFEDDQFDEDFRIEDFLMDDF
ncbi:hypothetical protein GGS20DRAFT_599118 [Poronia punctata]|nr:hypothetical protein GGS20DRAFT_599118 [Poronia punctata]